MMADPLAAIFGEYAALARNKDKFALMFAPQTDDRQLEFYPPWERDNPRPGKATVQVFNQNLSPKQIQDVVVADAMHYFGAVDPRNNKPVDPTFWKLKQQFGQSITPEQQAIDRRAYERAQAGEFGKPEKRPYDEWMNIHRLDQYLGAPLLPEGSENRRDWMSGMTQEQLVLLDLMKQYLKRGSIAPGMNR